MACTKSNFLVLLSVEFLSEINLVITLFQNTRLSDLRTLNVCLVWKTKLYGWHWTSVVTLKQRSSYLLADLLMH